MIAVTPETILSTAVPVPAPDWLDYMLRALGPGETVTHSGVSWSRYVALCETRDRELPGVKIYYLDGMLSVTAPSYRPQKWTARLGLLVEMIADELDIGYEAARATTFNNETWRAGLEADECFYFANVSAIAGREEIDLDRDPPPDVAIEVDMTANSTAKLAIYRRIRVPEVWRFDGDTIHVWALQPDGQYAVAERSVSLPALPLAGVVRFLQDVRHLILSDVKREIRVWVKTLTGGRS